MKNDRLKILSIASATLILCVVIGVGAFFYGKTGNGYPSGTLVNGIDISKKSQTEAAVLLGKSLPSPAKLEFAFTGGKGTSIISGRDLGAELETGKFLEDLMKREKDRTFWERVNQPRGRNYPLNIRIKYDRQKYDRIMTRVCADLEKQPLNCKINWEQNGSFQILPGEDGIRIDREKTFSCLPILYQGANRLKVPVVTLIERTQVGRQEVDNMIPLATYSTRFNPGKVNRTFNLSRAAAALNGIVVPAGGVFSFNGSVGPREADQGYREAIVIQQNKFTNGMGGGVCQVSTTLYNACLLSDLQILERHNHSVAITYVPAGLDATVAYKTKDLRFRNNTGGPIIIKALVSKRDLKITILGPSEHKKKVTIKREVSSVVKYKEIRKPEPTLPIGKQRVEQEGTNGCRVKCTRLVYDETGSLIRKEGLSIDTYKTLDKIVMVGTAVGNQDYPIPPPVIEDEEPVFPATPIIESPPVDIPEETTPQDSGSGGQLDEPQL
ncbi:MAG: VanW family protein [Chitinophagales bacterium]